MDTTPAPESPSPRTWRLRAELRDRPGALAKLTASLAARDCNILALTVLPVPDGVIDDLIVSTPEDLRPADLVTLVRATGGRCAGITQADVRDLSDAPTAALRIATRLASGAAGYAEAVRELLEADAADPTDAASDGSGPGDRQVIVPAANADGVTGGLVLRRGWAAFTEVELARTAALIELVDALAEPGLAPVAVLTSDGAGVVLRAGTADDADAVAAMHDRCSPASLFARYHTGTRSMPRRLHRSLTPPRGQTVVGVIGHQVVALGQLSNTNDPALAEVSLLVEDEWQHRGIGTALLTHLAQAGRAAGYRELVGWCLPAENGLLRTAARAGIAVSTMNEDQLVRVGLALGRPVSTGSAN